MANGKPSFIGALLTGSRSKLQTEEQSLQLFCQQIEDSSKQLKEWDIDIDPAEEIELLFQELKNRNELAERYCYDVELPRTIFHSFHVQPWMYTDIVGLWIIRDSGIPVLTFSMSQNKSDQILLAGFFGAVSSFANNLGRALQEIVLEGKRFLFHREPKLSLIFSMAVPFSMNAAQGLSLLSDVSEAFLSRYEHYFISDAEIVVTSEFMGFKNHLIDLFVQNEFDVYLKTGVLRAQNPLLFQLARNIMPCTDNDLFILRILEQNPNKVFSIQNIRKRIAITESKIRISLRSMERLNLIRSLQDGRNKKYTSNLRNCLLGAAVDSSIHHIVNNTLDDLLELIDERLFRV